MKSNNRAKIIFGMSSIMLLFVFVWEWLELISQKERWSKMLIAAGFTKAETFNFKFHSFECCMKTDTPDEINFTLNFRWNRQFIDETAHIWTQSPKFKFVHMYVQYMFANILVHMYINTYPSVVVREGIFS